MSLLLSCRDELYQNFLLLASETSECAELANLIYFKYNKQKLKYTGDEKWYMFEQSCNRWVTGYRSVRVLIYFVITDYIKLLSSDNFKDYHQNIQKTIDKLQDNAFVAKIERYVQKLFLDDNFVNKLNSNSHMMGFCNGVIDLEKNIFRDGKPSDLLSIGFDFDYTKYIKNDELEEYLKNLFPNYREREEIKTILCKMFFENKQFCVKEFGNFSCGISTFEKLIYSTFSHYCVKMTQRMVKSHLLTEYMKEKLKTYIGHSIVVIMSDDDTNGDIDDEVIETLIREFNVSVIIRSNDTTHHVSEYMEEKYYHLHFNTIFCPKPKKRNEKIRIPNICDKILKFDQSFVAMLLEHYQMSIKKFF